MDLKSDPYHQAEGGPGEGGLCAADAGNVGDGGCASLEITCPSDCPSGEFCCVTASPSGSLTESCRAPSACTTQSGSFQACASAGECGDGGSCIAQTCSFGDSTFTVQACTAIPFICTTQ
jgi:hypothetical protein